MYSLKNEKNFYINYLLNKIIIFKNEIINF